MTMIASLGALLGLYAENDGPIWPLDEPLTDGWKIVLAMVGGAASGLMLLPRRRQKRPPDPRPSLARIRTAMHFLRWPSVVVFALILIWAMITVGLSAAPRLKVALSGCPVPVEVRVLTSADSVQALSALAEDFVSDDAQQPWAVDCRRVHFTFSTEPSDTGAIADALGNDWTLTQDDGERLRHLGPRPDVWIPESSVTFELINSELTADEAVLKKRAPFTYSPLVLGIPERLDALEDARTDASSREILDRLRDEDLPAARSSPGSSPLVLLHSFALYREAGGDELPDPDALDRETLQELREIEGSVTVRDRPAEDANALLCSLRRESADLAALVSEHALVRHNRGEPMGGQCLARERRPTEGDKLLAYYPNNVPNLDFPFVVVDWPKNDLDDRRAAITRFHEWLVDDSDGQDELESEGLRPLHGTSMENPDQTPGALSQAESTGISPGPTDLSTTGELLTKARSPGRAVVLLDTSTSMAWPANSGLGSRHRVAIDELAGSLDQLGPTDTVEVWGFGSGAGERGWKTVGRVGQPRYPASRQQQLTELVTSLRRDAQQPRGLNVPFFQVVRAAVEELDDGESHAFDAVVILTDGDNEAALDTSGRRQLAGLLASGGSPTARVYVVTFGGPEGCGAPGGQALDSLARGWDGECLSGSAGMSDVFANLWSGVDVTGGD
ncbi:MAG: hypothetical protein ACRDPT_14735 [Streptomycetales bacterium]